MSWEDILAQLVRYGGCPDVLLLPILETLTDLNDDMCHARTLKEPLDNLQKDLDELRQKLADADYIVQI